MTTEFQDNSHLHDTRGFDDELLDEIVSGYIDRLNDGEMLDQGKILSENSQFGPAIWTRLKLFHELAGQGNKQSLGTLGDYTLRRQIARGGMGVVYEAWENSVGRAVALKVLPAGIAADRRAYARFMREAQAAGQLSHPNLVAVHAAGFKETTPYYAMEYVEGETLAQFLGRIKDADEMIETPFGKKGELAFYSNLASAFADVADGLQHAHSKGVVHRDIKPSNLILDAGSKLRILDFGLARLEGHESLTLSGDLTGTVLYMSPEQAMAKRVPLDHRTDVYSLGVTMYEALTSEPPFRGKDQHDTLSQIIDRDPRPPWQLNSRVPSDFQTIVLKCLRKDPDDRYLTAEALAQDLRRFVRGDAVEAKPEPKWETLIRRVRRHKALATVVVCVMLLVGMTGLVLRNHLERMQEANEALYRSLVLRSVAKLEQTRQSGFDSGETRREPAEDAVEMLKEATALFPDRADAGYYLARGLRLLGKKTEAESILERLAAGFFPAAVLEMELEGQDAEEATSGGGPGFADQVRGWQRLWYAARQAEQEQNWRAAAAAYGKLIEEYTDPEDGFLGMSLEVRLRRGRSHLAAKEYEAALMDFSAAAALWPKLLEPALLAGRTLLLLKKPGVAENVFMSLHAQTTFPDEAALAVIDIYHGLSAWKEGLEWSKKLENPADRERKRADFLRHLGQLEKALEAAEAARELDPEEADVYYELGRISEAQGELDEALAQFDKVLTLDPGHWAALERRMELGRGREAHDDGDLKKLVELCTNAIRSAPSVAESYVSRANAHRRLGDFEKAIGDLTTAIRLSENPHGVYSSRAGLFCRKRDFKKAIEDCTEAIRLDPTCLPCRNERGIIHFRSGDMARAIADFTHIIELSENHEYAKTFGYRNRGVAYSRSGNFKKAIADLTSAIELEAVAIDYFERAIAYEKNGEFDKAIADFTKRNKFHPRFASGYRDRAHVYLKKGDFPKAIADLTHAIELNPRSPTTYGGLTEALLNRGDLGEARRLIEELAARGTEASESEDRLALAYLDHALAEILLREGDYAEAARREMAAWDALPPEKRDPAATHGVLASCLALAESDETLSEDERRALTKTYSERMAELGRLTEEFLDPPFIPTGELTCLDLEPKANATLEETLPPEYVADNLAALPRGEQTFAGVRFRIADTSILLRGAHLPLRPHRVEGIGVGKRFKKLYIFHGAVGAVGIGLLLGRYEVEYEDASRERILIVNGEDVGDWWREFRKPLPRAKLAWVGMSPTARLFLKSLRLYVTMWENPHPAKRVHAIHFSSATKWAAPFCLAMTVEEDTASANGAPSDHTQRDGNEAVPESHE